MKKLISMITYILLQVLYNENKILSILQKILNLYLHVHFEDDGGVCTTHAHVLILEFFVTVTAPCLGNLLF